jgi:hypothetical protein
MTVTVQRVNGSGFLVVRPRGSRQAAFAVQLFVLTTFLLPSDTVIRVICPTRPSGCPPGGGCCWSACPG